MADWTRRELLAGLGTAAVGVGGYWWFEEDHCIDRRELRWNLDGRHWSPPVTDEYSVYVSERHGYTGEDLVSRVASLKRFDGEPNWVFTVTGGGAGVPLVGSETIYVGTGADYVYALDKQTGHVQWRYDAGGRETYGGGAWGQPEWVDGLVVVGISHTPDSDAGPSDGSFVHRVVALDAGTGEEVWARSVDAKIWTGPVAVGETVVAATEAGGVYGLAVGDGTERWRTDVGERVWESIFGGDDGAVYVASEDEQVAEIAALDAESGDERWTAAVSGGVSATERDGERFFVGTDSGSLTAFSLADGQGQWNFGSEAAIAAVSSDGALAYVLDQRGYVFVLDAGTGERWDRFRVVEESLGDRCGWSPKYERATGLVAGDDELFVTGPWVGSVQRHREE
ncbi:PQQ-binding-like beta-propeller repeat protein [Halorussus lipolyticus]|uniref:outer membrane protein assembly factor BamB family protein n=1 Tax=Halorussus lipolyticus TaxID=3034024 RepID=UPI0023E8B3EA|nr:PQQ-binding-like beta-propeller repeat protein [Halorussus sp. DT80]